MRLRRIVFFVLWAAALWALLYTGKPLYFYVFALMAITLILALLQLLLSVFSFRLRTNLNPRTAEKNRPIGWKLLPRGTFFPIAHVNLSVRFPDLGDPDKTQAKYYASPPFRRAEPVEVSISSPYSGSFNLEISTVEFTDIFGLFRVRIAAKRYLSRTSDLVYVLPDTALMMREAMMYDEIIQPIRRTRERAEAVGVREYRQDDDFRSIHWKYSARTGKLHVKEFEKGAKDLHIIYIDLVESPLANEAGFAARDYLLCAVAGFCRELLLEQIPIMLLAYSGNGNSEYPLTHAGRMHAARIFLARQIFVKEVPSDFQTSVANFALREKATMTIFSMAVTATSLSFLMLKSADFTSVALCLVPQQGYENEQRVLAHRFSDRGVYSLLLPEVPPAQRVGEAKQDA